VAPNLAELEVAKTQPGQQEGAAMNDDTPSPLGNVITIDDERIKNHLDRVVRGSVEKTLNALLDAEADMRRKRVGRATDPMPYSQWHTNFSRTLRGAFAFE
jgi:hypothetical protein